MLTLPSPDERVGRPRAAGERAMAHLEPHSNSAVWSILAARSRKWTSAEVASAFGMTTRGLISRRLPKVSFTAVAIDERYSRELTVDVDSVKTGDEVDQNVVNTLWHVVQESGCNLFVGWVLRKVDGDEELLRLCVDITNIDTTLVGEENPVTLKRIGLACERQRDSKTRISGQDEVLTGNEGNGSSDLTQARVRVLHVIGIGEMKRLMLQWVQVSFPSSGRA